MAVRKVPDGTEDADLFGTGLDGFTSGSVTQLIPATIVDHYTMNHLQEEMCQAIEGNGQTVPTFSDSAAAQAAHEAGTMVYTMLDETIRDAARCVTPGGVFSSGDSILNGLLFATSGASLTATLGPGDILHQGRRYNITNTKIIAAGAQTWTLPGNRDSYFFIAHQNPADSASNERTVYVERSDVAVGAAAPPSPAGTFLFARLTTDGSGVTDKIYYNGGPVVLNGINLGLRVKTSSTLGTVAYVVPHPNGTTLEIGERESPEFVQPSSVTAVRRVVSRQNEIVPTTFPTGSNAWSATYGERASTLGSSGTATIDIADEADWTDGTIIKVVAHVVAHDENDASASYAAIARFIGRVDAGAISLNGSGLDDPEWAEGSVAIANGVTVVPQITSGVMQLLLTGHSGASDVMRWYVRFELDYIVPDADNP